MNLLHIYKILQIHVFNAIIIYLFIQESFEMTFNLTKEEAQCINQKLSRSNKQFSLQNFFSKLQQNSDFDQETASISSQDKQRLQLIKTYKLLKSKLGRKSEAHKLQAKKIQQLRSKKISQQNEDTIELFINLQKDKKATKGLKKLSKIISELEKDSKENLYFLYDVNYLKLGLPSYRKIVQNPMSLEKISQKLKNHYYESFQQAQMDLNKIVTNSLLFNFENKQMKKITQKFQKNYLNTMFKHFQIKRYIDKQKIYEQVDLDQQFSKWRQQKAYQKAFSQKNQDSVLEQYSANPENQKKRKKLKKQNQKQNQSKKKSQNKRQKIYQTGDIKDLIIRVNSIFKDKNHPKRIELIQFIFQTTKTQQINLMNATYDQVKSIQQKLIEIQEQNPKPKELVEDPKKSVIKNNAKNQRKVFSQSSDISQSDT